MGKCNAIFSFPGSLPLAERNVPEGSVGAYGSPGENPEVASKSAAESLTLLETQ